MHSLKSTGIAVLLLVVSIGLYQFSANDRSSSNIDLATELGVTDGSQPVFNQQPFGQPSYQQPSPGNYSGNGGQANGQLVSSPQFANQTPHNGQGMQNRYPFQQNAQPAAPVQTMSSPSFDQLRNKFNQSANNAVGSATDQVNQQFNNLQNQASATRDNLSQNFSQVSNQAQNQLNQFNQSVGQAVNQTADTAKDYGNQLANNLQSSADSLQQNIKNSVNDFMPNLPEVQSATRQTIESSRDDGLIGALQTELNGAAENISIEGNTSGDFLAPPIQKTDQIVIDSDFSSNDFNPQLKAQPIELVNNAKNRLVSEQSPMGMDFNVQQANVDPAANGIDNSKLANIDQAWVVVEKMVDEKNFRGALALLTRYYRNDDLAPSQRTKLNDWLDALAGKVIYSAEHHFTSTSYKMKAGETLSDIANRWQVPAQVVYNINRKQIGNEPNVIAGTELKMINGPFEAEIDMSSQTLTLYLKNLYAGRFPVKLGISGNPRPGDYNVVAKSVHGHTWRDADGNDFPPESPENGYGPYWIGMTGSLCIHAISADEISGHSGCVGLSEKDAKDIFGILANRSKVKVVQ